MENKSQKSNKNDTIKCSTWWTAVFDWADQVTHRFSSNEIKTRILLSCFCWDAVFSDGRCGQWRQQRRSRGGAPEDLVQRWRLENCFNWLKSFNEARAKRREAATGEDRPEPGPGAAGRGGGLTVYCWELRSGAKHVRSAPRVRAWACARTLVKGAFCALISSSSRPP